ncbi:hypothetical protein [Paenibacillus xylanilyticus]|uniref:hypothetical protein n=1 Tax=Paenibacillus xylanilyticus TaxID=248903 RepID=UPI0039A05D24
MTNRYKIISIVIILILILTNILTFTNYRDVRQAETETYRLLVNRFYSYGILLSYDYTHLINERIKNETMDEEGIRVWLNEVVTNMKIAEETSSIAATHWNTTIGDQNRYDSVSEISHFYKSIHTNLLDIINTEKDYSVLVKSVMELEEILEIIKNNTSEQRIVDADYNEIKKQWRELMDLVYGEKSDSRLLKSYFSTYYSNES